MRELAYLLGIIAGGLLMIILLPSINETAAQTTYIKYGYQALNPPDVGGTGEIVAVKGKIYPYTGDSVNHVDRIVYLYRATSTTSQILSVGVGHYQFSNGNINFMMYFDEGLNDNYHLVVTSPTPSNSYTAEIVKVNSSTYAAKINGSTIKTWSCDATCPIPYIAGAAAWGASGTSNFLVYGNFWELQLKRPSDTQYQYFNSVSGGESGLKCEEYPTNLGFEYPLANNSINQFIVDATNAHECNSQSSVWLYRGGAGG
ncbi:MAG: hypothetical protein QXS98_01945 [Candidatus Nitrosocaldus sp.]